MIKNLSFFDFQKLVKQTNKSILQFLCEKFTLGSEYVEDTLIKLRIDKNKFASQLEQKEIDRVYRFFIESHEELSKQKIPEGKVKQKKIWYERYRWFFSSNDILVIAGKNPRNNETIIKRYTKPYDLILHSDIPNSPFAVIKNNTKLSTLPAETIYEAAELVVAYSKAWEENWEKEKCNIYYIKPSQISKNNLPLGEFAISGEKRWIEKVEPRLSIGVKEVEKFRVKLIFGPPTAVKKQTPYLVTIIPGNIQAEELAKEIKNQLLIKALPEIKKSIEEIELKEIQEIIPCRKGELVR